MVVEVRQLRWRQMMSSLYFPSSGRRFWARGRVSSQVGEKSMLYRLQPSRMKPTSNSALWAARGLSPAKSRKARMASSWLGAPRSISSVIPVSFMIS